MTKIPHLRFDGDKFTEMPEISQEEAMSRMMQAIGRGAKLHASRNLMSPKKPKKTKARGALRR